MSVWIRRLLPIIIILGLVTFLMIIIITNAPQPEEKQQVTPLPLVEVREIKSDNITLELKSYGVVQPRHQTQLVAEVRGRIVELNPNFIAGGSVKQGQILARIEPADYQADLMQAEAGLAQAQAALEEEIARGKVAEKEWKGVVDGVAPELGLRKPQLAQQQALLRSAQADLARAKRNLERTIIRAPFDGLIKSRDVDLGQFVSTGTNMGELLGTDIAEVRLPLSVQQFQFIDNPNTPTAKVELLQTTAIDPQQWNAKLVRSEQVIDAQSRMIYLVAELKDPYNLSQDADRTPLKFGSFVNAKIEGRTLKDIIRLPSHSVRDGKVMMIDADNKVQHRDVQVVHRDLDSVYVRGDIHRGERISLTALNSYQSGSEVRIMGGPSQTQPSGGAMTAEVDTNE